MRCQERRIGLDEQLLSRDQRRRFPQRAWRCGSSRCRTGSAASRCPRTSAPSPAPDEKQWKITVSGAPSARSTSSTSASASRLWIISGLPVRLARSMCQANASRWVGGFGAAVELARPVHVHAGLADRDHARMLGQPLDDGLGLVGERVGPGGVQRDRGVDPRVPVGGLGDPARGRRGRRRWSRRPARRRPRPGRRSRVMLVGVGGAAGVEVGVRVDQRGQRLRGGRCRTVRAAHGHTIS